MFNHWSLLMNVGAGPSLPGRQLLTGALRLLPMIAVVLLLGGCASYGVVENVPREEGKDTASYSIGAFQTRWRSAENSLTLAFSGGGSRAAALAYGVLQELRDTPVPAAGESGRLLDQVQTISSVSGGSFTAAYYGLHGDRIFDDFEDVFLRRNFQDALIHRLMNPFRWFGRTGRTEMAVNYYEDMVFKDATFKEMLRPESPLILLNASDLGGGVRFSFVQEYFDLLCSDVGSFPVARAVAASSAVPVLFNPVVVENYPDCDGRAQAWLEWTRARVAAKPELVLVVEGLESFLDRDRRRYVHFVDGGITDNLGLRAFYEVVEISGGIAEFNKRHRGDPPRRLVFISVNAATDPEREMDLSTKQPSIAETISAMSDVQLHRYNIDTIALLGSSIKRWAKALSTPERPVEPYFILLDFHGIQDVERRRFLNRTPTSFSLTDEQVDGLIAAGRTLLRDNPEFHRLMADIAADAQAGR